MSLERSKIALVSASAHMIILFDGCDAGSWMKMRSQRSEAWSRHIFAKSA